MTTRKRATAQFRPHHPSSRFDLTELSNLLRVVRYFRLFVRALVAQRLEQRTHNPLVVGSNPTEGTIYFHFVACLTKIFSPIF